MLLSQDSFLQCLFALHIKNYPHPLLTLLFCSFSITQIIVGVSKDQRYQYMVFQWFDIELYATEHTALYLFFAICIVAVLIEALIVLSIYLRGNSLSSSNMQNYLSKIASLLGVTLFYILFHSIIRTLLFWLNTSQIAEKFISVFTLILTTLFYFFLTFCNNYSPHNSKSLSFISFPNCFTFFNVYRFILPFVSRYRSCIVAINCLALTVSLLLLFLHPNLTWKYNRISRGLISIYIWIILCNLISSIPSQEVPFTIFIFGIPCFVIVLQWLVAWRIKKIMEIKQDSLMKTRILYFMVLNKSSFEAQIRIFLVSHFLYCCLLNCNCREIIDQFSCFKNKLNQDQLFALVLSEQKKILDTLSTYENGEESSKQQPKYSIRQLAQITLDRSQILHYKLKRGYESIQTLKRTESLLKQNRFGINNKARKLIELQRQQLSFLGRVGKTENKKVQHIFQFHSSIQAFKNMLEKYVVQSVLFWKQLQQNNRDGQYIQGIITQLTAKRVKIYEKWREYQRQKLFRYPNCQSNAMVQIIREVTNIYELFSLIMKSNLNLLNDCQIQFEQLKSELKQIKCSNYRQYSGGLAVVNVQEGVSFGRIEQTNRNFWRFVHWKPRSKVFVDEFLPKEFKQYHKLLMKSFLDSNDYAVQEHEGYILSQARYLLKVGLTVQLLANIQKGVSTIVLLTSNRLQQTKKTFMSNQKGQILYVNQKFKEIQKYKSKKSVSGTKILQQKIQSINKSQISLLSENLQKNSTNLKSNFLKKINTNVGVFSYLQATDQVSVPTVTKQQKSKKAVAKSSKLTTTNKISEKQDSIQVGLQSKRVKIWKFSVFSIFTLIVLLFCIASGFSFFRSDKYRSVQRQQKYLNELIINICESAYWIRFSNVKAFGKQKFSLSTYTQRIHNLTNMLVQLKTLTNLSKWSTNLLSFDMKEDGQIIQREENAQFVLHILIISSISSYCYNPSAWGFDYIWRNNAIRTNSISSLFRVVSNSYLSLLPNLSKGFRMFCQQNWNNIINIQVPILYLSSSMIALTLIIFFLTLLCKIKSRQAKQNCMNCLKTLTIKEIQDRIASLEVYLKYLREDQPFHQLQFEQPNLSVKFVNEGGKYLSNSESRTDIVVNQKYQITQKNNNRWYSVEIQNKKKLQSKKSSGFLKAILNIFALFLMTLVPVSLFIAQITKNNQVDEQTGFIDLVNQKIQSIYLSKSLSFEFAFEIPELRQKQFSLSNQMTRVIDNYYSFLRSVQSKEQGSGLALENDELNWFSDQFCKFLQTLSIKSKVQNCTEEEYSLYESKRISEVSIIYIETIRELFNQYRASQDEQMIRSFSRDSKHEVIRLLSNHLVDIEIIKYESYRQKFNNHIQIYEKIIFTLNFSYLIVVIVIYFWWIPRNIKKLNREMNEGRIIIESWKSAVKLENSQKERIKMENIVKQLK